MMIIIIFIENSKLEFIDYIIYFKISVGVVQMFCVCRVGDARMKKVMAVQCAPYPASSR